MDPVRLIVADADDRLADAVQQRLTGHGGPVHRLTEPDLFTTTSFALQREGRALTGWVHLGGATVPFARLSGVLLRLRRSWWPSSAFDQQDQPFVYHETTAAWFDLLSGLPGPVINRPPLGWWLRDPTFPERVRRRLAAHVELAVAVPPAPPEHAPIPTPLAESYPADELRIYLAGSAVLPTTQDGAGVADWFRRRRRPLAAWQVEYGLSLCRIDLDRADPPRIRYVEADPSLDGESDGLLHDVAARVTGLLG